MREDIIGIIKNAIERGSSPQQAARSLINSGYNQTEVNEALNSITGGTLNSLTPPQIPIVQRPSTLSQQKAAVRTLPTLAPQQRQMYQPKNESKGGGIKTLILFITLLLLTGLLLAAIFFKDKILDFLG